MPPAFYKSDSYSYWVGGMGSAYPLMRFHEHDLYKVPEQLIL